MKIEKVELNNFKFHSSLEFEIRKQNCLIYGENGTGKSSIYEALYSVFKIYFRNQDFNFEKFKKNDSSDEQEVKVTVDNAELKIPNENYSLPDDISLENSKTMYFANHDLLNIIINDVKDFNQIVNQDLIKYFSTMKNIHNKYKAINELVNSGNTVDQTESKLVVDVEYKQILNQVELGANDIINNHFKENFNIAFKFHSGELNNEVKFEDPTIILEINSKDNLKLNFNEAKLKLTSIAIFFTLIKIEEDEDNNLKLLVLDDFLTSLDMANRHYIIEYIFKEFESYQKIILTHNLQFNNLIIDYLKNHEDEAWDVKNIYLTKDNHGSEKANIYDSCSDYIQNAEEELGNHNLPIAGNLLRKEFERLMHELEKFYQIGKREEVNKILELILNQKPVFKQPHKLLRKIEGKINHSKNLIMDYDGNKNQIIDIINRISEDIENSKGIHCEIKLGELLRDITFYKTILMNRGSHDNLGSETYQKEYENALEIIKELKSYIEDL